MVGKKGQTFGSSGGRGIRIYGNQIGRVKRRIQAGNHCFICPVCGNRSAKPNLVKPNPNSDYRVLKFYCADCKKWVETPRDVFSLGLFI